MLYENFEAIWLETSNAFSVLKMFWYCKQISTYYSLDAVLSFFGCID